MKLKAFGIALSALPMIVLAESPSAFELGTITVTSAKDQEAIGSIASEQISSTLTKELIQTFNRETVGEALNLLAGVTFSTNSRNEQMIYVRGYDPRQSPLFIDGIPVYVPYDGYVDFGRFDTADLAAIQVAKGFSSVVYGPNTLGGAINLISRKPSKKFEADATLGVGAEGARRGVLNVGTNQGSWYLQAGAAYRKADGFRLSSDFVPTATEDGGQRDNSYYKDTKLTLKVGVMPSGKDEYALTYTRQEGEKGQPPSTIPSHARYWKWPYWDKESLYFISRTGLGSLEQLKLRLYYDTFDNQVDSYKDGTYTTLKTGGKGSVNTGHSIYHDKTYGGSIELESRRLSNQTLRVVGHYKKDTHEERDGNDQLNADYRDDLMSLSVEDVIILGERTILSIGFAHHELRPEKVYSSGGTFTLPAKQSANDPQVGLFYDLTEKDRIYATMAQKTRLPTLKDRYSIRLGRFIENPNLKAEKARNYEVGYQGEPIARTQAEVAIFWNEIEDMIQDVLINPNATSCNQKPGPNCQMQNIGQARIRGVELDVTSKLTDSWKVGGNATFLDLENLSNPSQKLRGIPNRKITLNTEWQPIKQVKLIGYVEHDGYRWAADDSKVDGFTIANLKTIWQPTAYLSVEVVVNNVTDQNYELNDGFPGPGRMWLAQAKLSY
ncbi:MAG: TonB-dependent receptor [Campylobacterales bacterium]